MQGQCDLKSCGKIFCMHACSMSVIPTLFPVDYTISGMVNKSEYN